MKYDNKAIKAARIVTTDDVALALAAHEKQPSNQALRRNLIRTQFVFVAAGLHALRYQAALGNEVGIPQRSAAKDEIEQAFNNLAGKLGINFTVSRKHPGWDAMMKSIRVRNRITHPKQPSDLVVSDPDMKHFNIAIKWFCEQMVQIGRLLDGKDMSHTVDSDARGSHRN